MKTAALFIWLALIMNPFFEESSRGNDKGPKAYTLPDDPTAAWAEVEKVHLAIQAPMEWRTSKPTVEEVARFRQQVCSNALSFAHKAREFIQRFPTNENIGDARIIVVHALNHAVAAGDATAEREIQDYVAITLADKSIPENDRVGLFLYSGNTAFCKKVGMRLFTEGMRNLDSEYEGNELDALKRALKQFPTNGLIYTLAVGMAQRSPAARQKELAEMILNAQGAPPATKTLADHLMKGTQPFEIGKPLSIKFTALDGREVDLAKLKGKVVLVEFWSTSCGPCVAEMPRVKSAYERFHERGFEIVGISLDDKESVLRRFIREKDLPWPQYFDGKGWENKFALQYGIFSVPTMWFVDRSGNLRSTQARAELEQLDSILAEKPQASQ